MAATEDRVEDAPKPSSYQDVLQMLNEGKTPPGIRVRTCHTPQR